MLYRLHDEAAALHAFRVAAGLDSMVPGEGEILGQVRAAYEAGVTGPVLDRLFRQALYAGKKVRAETAISESPTSVASAAAALAQQVFGNLEGCAVVVVGAGETGELTARNLAKRGGRIVAVVNRGEERSAALARRFGAEASGSTHSSACFSRRTSSSRRRARPATCSRRTSTRGARAPQGAPAPAHRHRGSP